jgi:uncharacterized membrane protein
MANGVLGGVILIVVGIMLIAIGIGVASTAAANQSPSTQVTIGFGGAFVIGGIVAAIAGIGIVIGSARSGDYFGRGRY